MDEAMENQEPVESDVAAEAQEQMETEAEAASDADSGDATDDVEAVTEAVAGASVSYGDLVDQDFGTALKVGAMPMILFGVLLVVAAFFYVARRKSAWSEEGLENIADDPQ